MTTLWKTDTEVYMEVLRRNEYHRINHVLSVHSMTVNSTHVSFKPIYRSHASVDRTHAVIFNIPQLGGEIHEHITYSFVATCAYGH
jgi:hypothetical protein